MADGEQRHPGAYRNPQPGPLTLLEPTRLVHVDDRLFGQGLGDLLDPRRERLARRLLQVGDTAEGDRHPESVPHQLFDRAFRQAVGAAQDGDQGLQARPERARRDPGRQHRPRRDPARLAPQCMDLELFDGRLRPRDLDHLMTVRIGVVARDGLAATQARLGLAGLGLVHLLGRHERTGMFLMSRLPAAPPSRALRAGRRRSAGRVARGRPGRVAGELGELCFKLGHPPHQPLKESLRLLNAVVSAVVPHKLRTYAACLLARANKRTSSRRKLRDKQSGR